MQLSVTVTELIEVPDGSSIITADMTGAIVGILLPSGETIRPWVCYEAEEPGMGDPRDLGHDELVAMGIDAGHDVTRSIE